MRRVVPACLLLFKVGMSLCVRFAQAYSCSTYRDTHHYVYHGLNKGLQSLTSYPIPNRMPPSPGHLQLIRRSQCRAFAH